MTMPSKLKKNNFEEILKEEIERIPNTHDLNIIRDINVQDHHKWGSMEKRE